MDGGNPSVAFPAALPLSSGSCSHSLLKQPLPPRNDMCLFRERSARILQSHGSAAINAVNGIVYVSYYNYPVFV